MRTSANWTLAGTLILVAGCCCTPKDLGGRCGGDTATIIAGAAHLQVKPECLAVDAGDPIMLEIRKVDGVGVITVESKPGPLDASRWLKGSSREGETIVIETPGREAALGSCEEGVCEYHFEIEAQNIGKLDPRVRIRYASH